MLKVYRVTLSMDVVAPTKEDAFEIVSNRTDDITDYGFRMLGDIDTYQIRWGAGTLKRLENEYCGRLVERVFRVLYENEFAGIQSVAEWEDYLAAVEAYIRYQGCSDEE